MNITHAIIKPIAAAAFVLAACVVGVAQPAVDEVNAAIGRMGLKTGFNRQSGEYVFIGAKEIPMGRPTATRNFLLRRERALRTAEFKAKVALLRARKQFAASTEDAAASQIACDNTRSVDSAYTVFSRDILPGIRTIAAAECYEDGEYCVAVAVMWREGSESAAALAPLREEDLPGLERWLNARDLAASCGAVVFRSQDGAEHVLGIGMAPASSHRSFAELDARKNLLFALYGDEEVSKSLRSAAIANDAASSKWTTVDEYESMASISVSDRVVPGMRSVAEKIARHPLTGADIRCVVYAIVARDDIEHHAGPDNPKENSRAKIWDPRTRSFVQQPNNKEE